MCIYDLIITFCTSEEVEMGIIGYIISDEYVRIWM